MRLFSQVFYFNFLKYSESCQQLPKRLKSDSCQKRTKLSARPLVYPFWTKSAYITFVMKTPVGKRTTRCAVFCFRHVLLYCKKIENWDIHLFVSLYPHKILTRLLKYSFLHTLHFCYEFNFAYIWLFHHQFIAVWYNQNQ